MRAHTASSVAIVLLFAMTISERPVAADFTDHGTAVPVARSFGATATVDEAGNRLMLIWLGDHTEGVRSKLVVDVDSGETKQVEADLPSGMPGWETARGIYLSSDNLWYASFGNRFFEFDPDERAFTFVVEMEQQSSYALTEAPDGVIWGGTRPDAHLISFDPQTREFTDHGSMNDEDWGQYVRSIAADDEGWVYMGISIVEGQVVGYHPESGDVRRYVDDEDRARGRGTVRLGEDGHVYATAPGWSWHKLAGGEATEIEGGEMPVAEASLPAGYHSMVKDEFPDGARVTELDVPNRALMIEESDGTEREVPFDYETPGARIYSMAKGPDGVIYGGTGHPTYVFRFDVETGDLRAMQHSGGHVNAIATQGDKVYLAMYAGGAIYEYDVSMPWAPDDEANPNPVRVVEHGRPEIVRPSALKAHPDGRHLIMAGSPRGGRTAGGLFIYDIEQQAGELISHADLLENLNTRGLVALPNGDLVGTTTTRPGTGGQRRADEAELYILDWENRKVAWRETILPDEELGDLILGPDGLVYGITVDATLFVFDPEARKLLHEESLSEYGEPAGSQAPRHVARGADEEIYILFEGAIVSLSPGSFKHRKLAKSPDEIRVGIVVDGDRIYFSSYTDLWSYQIP